MDDVGIKDGRQLQDWLVRWADPLGTPGSPPKRRLSAGQLERLFVLAEMHGVLGPVLAGAVDAAGSEAYRQAVARYHAAIGFNLMLRQLASAVVGEVRAAGGRLVVVKGPTFARLLYPERSLRRFTDIDFLADAASVRLANEALAKRGFLLADKGGPHKDEWCWYHPERSDLSAEVHENLVHSPTLRSIMSLTYSDLVSGDDPEEAESPAALLLVAVAHGAAHHFERLLHVLDIVQAARTFHGAGEDSRLAELVARTGTRRAAIAGLCVAGTIFDEPRCFEIARGLGARRVDRAYGRLIDASVVVSMMDERQFRHSWRRSLFRLLLKKPEATAARP